MPNPRGWSSMASIPLRLLNFVESLLEQQTISFANTHLMFPILSRAAMAVQLWL